MFHIYIICVELSRMVYHLYGSVLIIKKRVVTGYSALGFFV